MVMRSGKSADPSVILDKDLIRRVTCLVIMESPVATIVTLPSSVTSVVIEASRK